jgi:hypothetical protein
MQPVVLVLLVTAALASLAIASEPASAPCGVVFDGARKGDIDLQRATDSIAAHWFDFEDGLERNRVLRYEWAVVSESMTTPALKCMCWCEGSRVRAWVGGWDVASIGNGGQKERHRGCSQRDMLREAIDGSQHLIACHH